MAARPDFGGSTAAALRVVRGAVFGFALGLSLTAFACAAVAAQSLHTGLRIVDWAIGIALLALPLVLLFGILRLVSILAVWVLHRLRLHALARIARAIGHPLVAASVGIVILIWLVPADSFVSLYHGLYAFESLIFAGALVGMLAGIGFGVIAARPPQPATRPPRPAARVLTAVFLGAAIVVGSGAIGWASMPGFGDTIVHEPAAVLEAIPLLELPDPSQPGPHAVITASYGSGGDGRRPEFGTGATWLTQTVDASRALGSRGPVGEPYADWFWGHDSAHLPLNGLVWFPAESGRMPLALIVHGNHDAGDYSDPGYAYLAAHLASRGIIAATIDENYLNGDAFFDYAGREIGVRAWLLLRHLEQFAEWDASAGHPLEGSIDFDRIALIGHSRGGEAATLAAMLTQRPDVSMVGLSDVERDFGVRTVVAIAPSDGMYVGPGRAPRLRNVDYLAIQGAHDGDLPSYTALQPYHRVEFDEPGHLKVALYSARANHGRFNAVWDYGDAGPTFSWMLDRASILSADEQQRLAKTVIGAFLARSLQGQTSYDSLFREPRAGRAWLPDDVVQTHWESSESVVVDSMERIEGDSKVFSGFEVVRTIDPPLRDGTTQRDRAVLLEWDGPASLTVALGREVAGRIPADGSLVFSMAPAITDAISADPTIELQSSDGSIASVRLGAVAAPRPLIPVKLWKLDGLGDRYLPQEHHRWPAERFLQTYELPMTAFNGSAAGLDPRAIVGITFRFDGSGSAYLDGIGFEGPVNR